MKPTIGRIVHYVTEGIHLAAIVTHVDLVTDGVDLAVFWPYERTIDYNMKIRPADQAWTTGKPECHPVGSVAYDERMSDGTWHWPERE